MLFWTFFNVVLPLTPVVLTLVALVRLRDRSLRFWANVSWGKLLGDGILYFLTVVLALSLAANAIAAITGVSSAAADELKPGVALGACILAMVIFAAALLCYYFAIEDRINPEAGDGKAHAVISLVLVFCAAGSSLWFRSMYHLW